MGKPGRWAGGLTVAVALAAAVSWYGLHFRPRAACEDAIAERRFKDAVPLCTSVYERSGDGRFAAAAAMAHVGVGEMDKAWRLANEPAARDLVRARRIRGVVLNDRGDEEAAERELQTALTLALERGEPAEAARAAHRLAGMKWQSGLYSQAYDYIELSGRQAELAEDGPARALAELAKGDVYRYLGDAQKADACYRRALDASAKWPSDHAYAALKAGNAYLERGESALARRHFEIARSLAEASRNSDALAAVRGRLAEALIAAGEADAAEWELDAIPERRQNDWDVLFPRAQIALLRKDPTTASRILARLDPAQVPPQDEWELLLLRGRVALQAGDVEGAVDAWQSSISEVEALTRQEPAHQAWVAARRRRPYDALFALHASRGEHDAAWNVVARYARAEALTLSDPSGVDARKLLTEAETKQKRRASGSEDAVAPGMQRIAPDDGREILVVHEAEGRLWVGLRRARAVRFVDAGPREHFEGALSGFLANAGDEQAASILGEALWTTAGLGASKEPLFIVGTGRIKRLAFAALQKGGRRWVELRPLARLATLDAPSGRRSAFDGAPVVAGDPRGDLAEARAEALAVAGELGVAPLVGVVATRAKVLEAQRASVLHLATHATIGLEGTALLLADGELSAQEVLERRPSARVVVLASCASAVGRETSGADSLATAFLRAGSGAVLATVRTVPDAAAHQLVEAFYRQGGAKDPVRGLAAAQLELLPSQPVQVWSAFTVIVGPELSAAVAESEVAGR